MVKILTSTDACNIFSPLVIHSHYGMGSSIPGMKPNGRSIENYNLCLGIRVLAFSSVQVVHLYAHGLKTCRAKGIAGEKFFPSASFYLRRNHGTLYNIPTLLKQNLPPLRSNNSLLKFSWSKEATWMQGKRRKHLKHWSQRSEQALQQQDTCSIRRRRWRSPCGGSLR